MIYDVGDAALLRHEVRLSGALTAATVALSVIAPDGTASTPAVTSTSTGVYTANVPITQTGLWLYIWAVSGAVVDIAPGFLDARDPAPPAYVSLALLKTNLKITDTDRDELLGQALVAASRGIDDHCGRRFYSDRAVSARTWRTFGRVMADIDGELLLVDDIASTTGLVVEVGDGTTWSAVTDYFAEPDNALALAVAITGLRRNIAYWSPNRRVRVTARWGWPAVPTQVEQATLIQATRLFRRKDSPEGVTGNAEWGTVRLARIDPDVQALVNNLVLPGFA